MKPIIEINKLYKKYHFGREKTRRDFRDYLSSFKLIRNVITGDWVPSDGLNPNEFWALKDINLDIFQGDIIGIIGPNGAGKSTLLKILSRVTIPTRGEIILHGKVSSLLEVGTGFNADMTGRENVFLNGAILGMSNKEIKRKFDEIVDFSGVEKFIDTPVKHYSSGMYMRLAFAIAAHLEPEILIVDEVLAVGDTVFQQKSLGKMNDMAKKGRTVIFVSHSMPSVSALCQKAVLLDHGQIRKIGSPREVISKYLSRSNKSGGRLASRRRPPGLEPILTKFIFGRGNGVVFSGEPLNIKVSYKLKEKIYTPQFCVAIYTMEGSLITTLVSSYQPNNIPTFLNGNGEVTCQIGEFPLLPGNYKIDLQLWQPGKKLDEIVNIEQFRVEWGEKKERIRINYNSGLGPIYTDAQWKLGGGF